MVGAVARKTQSTRTGAAATPSQELREAGRSMLWKHGFRVGSWRSNACDGERTMTRVTMRKQEFS